MSIASVCESLACDYYLYKESKLDLPNALTVSCTGIEDPFVDYFHSEITGKIKKIQYTNCKPIAIPDPNIEGSEWKECECTVYTHIPGGRKAIWEQCIELEKKFESKR